MISGTRRFFRRYRSAFTVGAGVIGIGYLVTKYVLGKIAETREQYSSDRIARENLSRRFNQNQADCTFTVLGLLPTATENVLNELQTERITYELNQQKASNRLKLGELQSSENSSSPPSVTEEDGRSTISLQSESGVHASQMAVPSASVAGDGPQDGGQQKSPKLRKSKAQLWYDLRISSITRAFTLLYTLALLTLMTRIQLNLLGRRSYLSSVVTLASGPMNESFISLENNDDDNPDQAYGNDLETDRRYLTFSWWLLHRGWKEIMHKVEAAVKEVFGPLSARDDLTLERFSELTLEVRRKVEGATDDDRKSKKWLSYLLPPREDEEFVLKESGMALEAPQTSMDAIATPLRRLLDETSDLIDSPPFTHVLTLLLDSGFSTLVDTKLADQAYNITPGSDANSNPAAPPASYPPPISGNPLSVYNDLPSPRIAEIIESKPVKLPIILAVMTKQAHAIGNGVPNEYLKGMDVVKGLEAFAAVVYSSNWQSEIAEEGELRASGVDLRVESGSPVSNAGMQDISGSGSFDKLGGESD